MLWFCAGSVGLVYEHKEPMDEQPFDPWAEYAVLTADDGKLRVEFRRVPFDVEELVRTTAAMPDETYATMWKRP